MPLVLEIGTGSGYQAAVLATIGARVRLLERLPALAAAARERLAGLGLDGAVAGAVEVIVTPPEHQLPPGGGSTPQPS